MTIDGPLVQSCFALFCLCPENPVSRQRSKAPLLVLDDADLDQAVSAAAFGAFIYQGQVCMSTERVVVDDKIADDFVTKFAGKAQSLAAGNPRNGNIVLGPMIGVESAQRVEGLIKNAVAKGAKLMAGGQREGAIMAAAICSLARNYCSSWGYSRAGHPIRGGTGKSCGSFRCSLSSFKECLQIIANNLGLECHTIMEIAAILQLIEMV
jgi:hypothetical protein